MKSRWLSAFLVLTLAALGLTANVAYSQTVGDIEGTVTDTNGSPLPGAAVEARSSSLQGVRTKVTDAAGRFRFPALPPGVYTVAASLSGFGKVEKSNIHVQLGATATIPISMSVSVKEEIVVTGEAPVVDTTKTAIGLNATLDQIQHLPMGRNFASVANGVAGTGTDVSGNVTVYGATGLENSYIIDGVNTTGIKIGTQAKTLNNEFVQEVEVRTGGYEAEYGRVLGGTINVITKSGGNDFKGDAFGYYDSDSLAANDSETTARHTVSQGAYSVPKRIDAGADLGGFFVKDRLWFFGAYDRVTQDQPYERVFATNRDKDPKTGLFLKTPAFGTGTDNVRNNLYSGKLTFRLGESNTLAASIFGDPGTFQGRASNTAVGPESSNRLDRSVGGADYSLKYDGIFGTNFLVQAQYGFHQDKAGETSPFSSTLYREQSQAGFTTEALPGAGPVILRDETYRRNIYKASGTFFMGTHEIKGGIDWEHLNSDFSETYGGNDRLTLRLNATGTAVRNVQHRYFAQTPVDQHCLLKVDATKPYAIDNCQGYAVAQSVDNNPTTDNVALFAQDSFKVLKNLTINAGLRYEQQSLKDFTGASLVKIQNEWAPRIGVVWDLLNNGKSKAYGSYGRFYETVPQDIQTRALGNEYIMFVRNNSQTSVDPINTAFPFAYVQGGEIVQDNLKGMYQDELIAGFEYEVAKGWAIGVKGIYKALGGVVEDRCDVAINPDIAQFFTPGSSATCALINPGQGNALGTIKDPGDKTCYPNGDADAGGNLVAGLPCASTQARRYFRGVELTVNHRFSDRFYFLASYLYSKLEGNYSGNLSQTRTAGQSDPNINADFDYPGLVINAYGLLPNDRTHQAKLSGYYAFPFGLTAGMNASYTSGRPYSIRGCTPDQIACGGGYSQEGYLVPRGSAGTLPAVYEADLHLEYGIRVGQVSITPIVDIFNILNRQGVVGREELFNNDGTIPSNNPANQVGAPSNPNCTAAVAAQGFANACATNPNFGKDNAWQTPRVFRVGARVSF